MVRKILFVLTLACGIAALGFQFWKTQQQAAVSSDEPFQMLGPSAQRAGQAIGADGRFARFTQVPDFSLADRSGAKVGLANLKGKVWLASFIYTTCPETCPMLSHRLSKIHEDVIHRKEFADVRFVSFSVDPEHDSPSVLQAYALNLRASGAWYFLTGDRQQLVEVATKGFMLGFDKSPIVNDPAGPVNHSTKIVLVDSAGVVRRFYEGVGPDESQQIKLDLRKLLKEEKVYKN
jgi:protein SCO1/2